MISPTRARGFTRAAAFALMFGTTFMAFPPSAVMPGEGGASSIRRHWSLLDRPPSRAMTAEISSIQRNSAFLVDRGPAFRFRAEILVELGRRRRHGENPGVFQP